MDDASTDNTKINAQKMGVEVISQKYNQGLAKLFTKGIEEALKRKAEKAKALKTKKKIKN